MNFGSLFSFIIDIFVFSVMTSISLVETPVDRRRFVFSSVFVATRLHIGRMLLRRRIRRLPPHIWIFICIF